jgi:hypothetical protein
MRFRCSLNFNSNRFTKLPDALGNLVTLTRLLLQSNHLHEIPTTTSALTALTELDLRGNAELKHPSPEVLKVYNRGGNRKLGLEVSSCVVYDCPGAHGFLYMDGLLLFSTHVGLFNCRCLCPSM